MWFAWYCVHNRLPKTKLMGLGPCSGSVDSRGQGSAVGPNSDEAPTIDSGEKKVYCSLHIAFCQSWCWLRMNEWSINCFDQLWCFYSPFFEKSAGCPGPLLCSWCPSPVFAGVQICVRFGSFTLFDLPHFLTEFARSHHPWKRMSRGPNHFIRAQGGNRNC